MKKIALVWGWSGWHITPLVSIYNFLKDDNNFEFFWIWEKDSLEEKIAKENWIRFISTKSGKLRRYFSFKTLLEPFNIIAWILSSKRILKQEKPDIIFSKWGYVSLPVAIAAKKLGIKLFLHESDTIPWLANRFVGKFASKIYVWFKKALEFFPSSKCELIWQILNPELFRDIQEVKKTDKTNLLVIAWSQWSTRIFSFLAENLNKLKNFDITVILWSLNSHLKENFKDFSNVKTFDFINHSEIKNLYNEADIAITRWSATTLAELENFWIKLIVIPLKESANNHQYYNALEYEKKWSVVVLEDNLNDFLIDEIIKLKWYKKVPKDSFNNNALDKIRDDLLN